MTNTDGSQSMDADAGQQVAVTNVFVLYASSGIKDDGYNPPVRPVRRHRHLPHRRRLAGDPLVQGGRHRRPWCSPTRTAAACNSRALRGKSYIAVWGGYYGQALSVKAEDGAEQTLPARPALLESGVSDEAAAQAQQDYDTFQAQLAASLATPTPAPAA